MTFTVTPTDLGLYLNDAEIKPDRAELMINLATSECLTVIDPLPDPARVVVLRVAARGYTTAMSAARQNQLAAAGSPIPLGGGGIYLTKMDKADLRRNSGTGGAFSVNLLDGYQGPPYLPVWDAGITVDELTTS